MKYFVYKLKIFVEKLQKSSVERVNSYLEEAIKIGLVYDTNLLSIEEPNKKDVIQR